MPSGDGWTPECYLLNTAWTEVLPVTVKVQVGDVPEQAPTHFTNVLPAGGVAVKVTTAPSVNFAEQLLPQESTRSLPEGEASTVPELLRPTDSEY